MIAEEQRAKLKEMCSGIVLFDESLKEHSAIKIGGIAAAYVEPQDAEGIIQVLKFAKENHIEVTVIGAGTNLLFRDSGFDGIVMNTSKLNRFELKKDPEGNIELSAQPGVLINELVNMAVRESVSGFEHLAGIPGTVGGALHMNAGTHNGVISDSLVEVNAVDKSSRSYTWPKEKLEFSYRKTKFPKSCVVLNAKFLLKKAPAEEIAKVAEDLRTKRKERHPLSWPSLGSIFKNPRKGPSAGQLIEEAGLKGVRVGGARIANEHANWIINEGNATAKDVEVLIHLIREKVKETGDTSLETEIVIIGKREES